MSIDEGKTYWLLVYEDADRKPEVFTDEDAARRTWADRVTNWNVRLFAEVQGSAQCRFVLPKSHRPDGYDCCKLEIGHPGKHVTHGGRTINSFKEGFSRRCALCHDIPS